MKHDIVYLRMVWTYLAHSCLELLCVCVGGQIKTLFYNAD